MIEQPANEDSPFDAIDLERALCALEKSFDRPARVIEMWYFAGASLKEIASELGVSLTTVKGEKDFGKAFIGDWLRKNPKS